MTDIAELGRKMAMAGLAASEAITALLEATKPSDFRTEEQKAREADVATAMLRDHFATMINEVLADHTPRTSTHHRNADQSLRILCHHDGEPSCNFPDEQGWRNHVSMLIAQRLMKDPR